MEENQTMSDEYEDSYEEFDEQPSGSGGGNRNFVIAIVAVIVVFVVLIVGIGGFYFLTRSGSGSGERSALASTQAAMIYTQNAQTAAAATKAGATEIAKNLLPTETLVPPTAQNASTSVVVFATNTPAPTIINAQVSVTAETVAATAVSSEAAQRTGTIAVLLTQVATSGGGTSAAGTFAPLTPTALPKTGFMEDVGLPVLLGMAMLFVFIIFMARRLRVSANNR
jgi:LPXTG-motif cell wall-anchored protein